MERRVSFLHIFALLAFASALVAGCSRGGVVTPPAPTPDSVTQQIAQAGGTIVLPSVNGLSGSMTVPANNATAGTTMTVSMLSGAPSGAPVPAAYRRMTSTPTTESSLEIQVSQTVTFQGFPGFALTLPASISTAGENFYIAVYQGTGSSAPLLVTIGPATVNGQVITFAPTATPITLQAGVTYLVELYEVSAASASPSPSPSPSLSPSPSPTPSPTPSPSPSALAIGTTYVLTDAASSGSYDVQAFPQNANGAATALSSFTFSPSSYITGMTVDATGRVYIMTSGVGILSFAYGATGSATPSTTLTTVTDGWGLAVDPSDNLVVTDYIHNLVDFFAPGTNGGAAPIKQIAGSGTQINYPYQAAFDGSGNLYVLNANSPSSITEYSAASIAGTGTINASPSAVVTSSTSALDGPEGLAVDSTGRIYVGNSSNNTISVFAPGSNGIVSPVATLSGSSIGFSIDQATIAVDSSNDFYVASSNSSNAVYVFAPVTSSAQTPIRTITGVSYAGGIGIVP